MAHELASAFQQAIWIGNLSAAEEANIDVSCEDVDIRECRVSYTRRRMTVMQYLSNIVSAVAHGLKPALRDCPQFARMLTHPGLDSWLSSDRTGEQEETAHEPHTGLRCWQTIVHLAQPDGVDKDDAKI